VLPKRESVPDIVTAGLATVGLRMPSHPLALALIRAARVPIAAPSANRFSELSPTTADHVRLGLGDAVDLILDGGPTRVGIESTVLSLAGETPVLLRPGMATREDIERWIGKVTTAINADGAHPSPGMHPRHYSPRTPLILVEAETPLPSGSGALLWIDADRPAARSIRMPLEPDAYGAQLYAHLHELDPLGFDWIAVERPPEAPEWAAILDRLVRASR
jgi:L-threonylcarbamoyladenylate synthase